MDVSIPRHKTAPSGLRGLTRVALKVVTYVALVGGGLLYTLPFLWMIRTALMSTDQLFVTPTQWLPNPIVWDNLRDMWNTGPFLDWISNSLIVTVVTVIATTTVSSVVAFGFARTKFPGRNALFVLVLATMMVPGHVTIIPRFVIYKDIGWLDTLLPLIVPSFFGSAFYIFILRQFFLTLPLDLDEAAEIDGAGILDILRHVTMPLSKPAIASVAVFAFIGAWNDFFEPLVFIQTPERLTLAVGINWFRTQYGTEFQMLHGGIRPVDAPDHRDLLLRTEAVHPWHRPDWSERLAHRPRG